jgi:hypothetical protein
MSASSSVSKEEIAQSEDSLSVIMGEKEDEIKTIKNQFAKAQHDLDLVAKELKHKAEDAAQVAKNLLDAQAQGGIATKEWRAMNRERIRKAHQQGVKGTEIAEAAHELLNTVKGESDQKNEEHEALLDEHGATLAQYDQQYKEHDARLNQHGVALTKFKQGHDSLHQRLGKVEAKHQGHAQRMGLLEGKHSEISSKQNWIGPVVVGLAATSAIAGLWFLISKVMGGKRKDRSGNEAAGAETDSEDEDGGRTTNHGRRGHARAWNIAPEVSASGTHYGKYTGH